MAYHVEYAADSWTFLSECQMKKKRVLHEIKQSQEETNGFSE